MSICRPHQWEIRDALGLVEFSDAEVRVREFLGARAWTRRERPSELFDHAVVWLRNEKVLLPGVTVLERLVAEVRSRIDDEMYATIAGRVDSETERQVDALLITPAGRLSQLEYYRRSPNDGLGPPAGVGAGAGG